MDGLPAPTLRFLLLLTACGCRNFLVASEESGPSDNTSNASSGVLTNLISEGSDKTVDNGKGLNDASGNNTQLVISNGASRSELSIVASTALKEDAAAARALSDEKSDMPVSRQGADNTSVVGAQAADPSGRSQVEDNFPSGQSASAPSRQGAASSIPASGNADLPPSQSADVDGKRNDPVTDIVDALSDGASDSTRNDQLTDSVSASGGGSSDTASVRSLDDPQMVRDKSAENISAASAGASKSASTGNGPATASFNSSSDRASGSASIGSVSASDGASTDASSSSASTSRAADSKRPGDKSNASTPDGQSADSTSARSTDAAAAAAVSSRGQTADRSSSSSSVPKGPSTKIVIDGSSSPAPEATSGKSEAQTSGEEEEAWEVLDPSSEDALARAKKRTFSRTFLKVYEYLVDKGRAKELMPDPFFERNEPDPEPFEEQPRFVSMARKPREVKPTNECNFVEGHDFIGHDVDTIPNSNKYDCCRACARRNKVRPGSCTAAVLSSGLDTPPNACWLKNDIQTHTVKQGVVGCIPKDSDVGSKFPDLVV